MIEILSTQYLLIALVTTCVAVTFCPGCNSHDIKKRINRYTLPR